MNTQTVDYRGKHYTLPVLSAEGTRITPDSGAKVPEIPRESPVIQDLNSIWDTSKFMTPRAPVSLGVMTGEELEKFGKWGVPRVLDLPIKFPGSDFRLPKELEQFADLVQKVANYELAINPGCFDEYYCYMTVDQGVITPGRLQREAPCHVDGFQGARWEPKVRINHSYTVGDALPTKYYVQPFDFSQLDEAKHNYFWEMNRQVAATNSEHACQPVAGEITMMDAYCVHRGVEAEKETPRTWVRLSFEVRQFDRLGNAHNPMFSYKWSMVPRDIEGLNLQAFDPGSDPSLRVFPWQDLNGEALTDRKARTSPNLKPGSDFGDAKLPGLEGLENKGPEEQQAV
jgi:hypothetical protein